MREDPITGNIRAKVVCVFRNENRILVGDAYDPTEQERFYCPPGGRIEFGETSIEALRREMKEELGSEIENPVLLGVLENLFTFDGRRGHEIVFVYEAKFADRSLYSSDQLEGQESNGQSFNAIWLDPGNSSPDTLRVYPDGLVEMVAKGQQDSGADGM